MKFNRILQLLNENRNAEGRRFEVRALADDEVEVLLYDAIVDDEQMAEWYGGVAPKSFVLALRQITAATIHLRINSPGGSVFAARAMETALREHSAKIVVHIDGVAASAATFVAMAGDEIRMAPGALFMIHKAWTVAWGNEEELLATAGLLAKIDGTLAATYAQRTGQAEATLAEWMRAETWFTAEEAKAAGFVDVVEEQAKAQAGMWNLAAFENAPRGMTPQPPPAKPAADPGKPAPEANQLAQADTAALLRRLTAACIEH